MIESQRTIKRLNCIPLFMIKYYLDVTEENIHACHGSTTGGFHVVHPQNDAILAHCDTIDEARAMIEGFNNYPEAFRQTTGYDIK